MRRRNGWPPPRDPSGGQTLQGQLMAWVLGALLVVWLGLVGVGYATGHHEADELTDGHLASVASLMLAEPPGSFRLRADPAALGRRSELKAHDYQQSLSVVVWDAQGRVRARTGGAPLPPFGVENGFHTLSLGPSAEPWRIFARWEEPERSIKVAVMLDLEERDALASDIAEHVVTPGLWLLPVVGLVLVIAIRRGLRPLHALITQVRLLDVHHPRPLQAPPHQEFQGMVGAIHQLSDRYATAVRHEREVADAFAHELRTPLASLRLHAATLRGPAQGCEREASLQQIEADAERAVAVIRDLLALARASRLQLAEAQERLDLCALAREVVAEFGQASCDSGHELALEARGTVPVRGHPVLLEMALRNLLDNALAHTAPGTFIEVRVNTSPTYFEVCDNGRAAGHDAFDASVRSFGVGLGLGHQVVRRVAEVHGGRFDVIEETPGPLRRYRVSLGHGPAPSPDPGP